MVAKQGWLYPFPKRVPPPTERAEHTVILSDGREFPRPMYLWAFSLAGWFLDHGHRVVWLRNESTKETWSMRNP